MGVTYRSFVLALISLILNVNPSKGQAPGGCSWSVVNNMNTPGGTYRPGVTSVEDCQSACSNQYPSCQAIDFDKTNPLGQQCWFSNLAMNTQSAMGIDHYSLTCGNNGILTTQNPFSAQFTPACYWNSTSNVNSQGGVNHPEATTLDQCKSICSNNVQTCKIYGFDWNDNQPGYYCWLSQNAVIGRAQGISHYQLICPVITQPPPTGTCQWTIAYNTHSIGGILMASYTSLVACQQGCLKDSSCVAIDWPASGTNQCWFAYSQASEAFGNMNRYSWGCSGSPKISISGFLVSAQLLLLIFVTRRI